VYIWLQLCQILTDFNNFYAAKTGKMYKTGHAFTYLFTYLLLKESVAYDVINVSLFDDQSVLWTTPSMSGVVVYRPASTLMTDILNTTYDCYSQNNNVEMAALHTG